MIDKFLALEKEHQDIQIKRLELLHGQLSSDRNSEYQSREREASKVQNKPISDAS